MRRRAALILGLSLAAACARETSPLEPSQVSKPPDAASAASAGRSPDAAAVGLEVDAAPAADASKERPPLSPALAALVAARKPGDTIEQRQDQLIAMLDSISKDHSPKSEAVLVEAVKAGLHDPPQWVTIESRFRGHRAKIRVSADALQINHVRVDFSAVGAQQVADALGTILPTPAILDLVWKDATVKIDPCAMTPDEKMHSNLRMLQHTRCVDARLKGRPGLAANVGKNWVLTNTLEREAGMAANYGWFRRGRRPIQTVGTRHDKVYADYSQIVRLVDPIVNVDGRDMDIRTVGRSHELWGLVADDGPLRVWRVDLRGSDGSRTPARALLDPPPDFPPSNAPAVAFAPQGHPLALEQLPETTFALRHARLVRFLLDEGYLDEADLPEEAVWSAGAARCGYRDPFLEAVTGAPVTEGDAKANLSTFQRALACGQALADEVKKGRSYEVDYTFDGEPSSFALLRSLPRASWPQPNFPLLPHAPGGAISAACRDGDGATARSCEHGDRSRLLLEVRGGIVASYAREAPRLLGRLGATKPAPADVKALRELYDAFDAFEMVDVARADHCALAIDGPLAQEAHYPTSSTALVHALMESGRFCAVGRSGGVRRNGQWRIVVLAKDEANAAQVEAALRQRVVDMATEVRAFEPMPASERAFRDTIRAMRLRAARAATIRRQGDRVEMELRTEPTEQDLRALTPYLQERRALAMRAAATVRALAQGTMPAPELLAPKKR
jgi:hypothetical protein